MSFAQRRVQLLAGLVVVAIVAIGAGISAFYGLTATRQAAAPAITGPAAGTQAKVVIPFQAQGFVGSHPGLYESDNAALSPQQDSAVLSQEQANTKVIQDGAAAIMAERAARADALQQQALMMLDEGKYQRAQELSKQREAVLRGADTTSVSTPAPTDREARAEALRKQGDDYLRTGDWMQAQEFYKQSQAIVQGEAK